MKYLVFDHIDACTQADVERLLPLVSKQRREQALRFKHLFGQWTCLKAYEMLLTLFRQNGYLASAEPMPEWQYNRYGKPYIEGLPDFSISHCRQAVAVAISISRQSPIANQIGIDVESIREVDNALIERVMNVAEQQQIREAVSPQEAFTRLWTQKEAVLKLRGTGIIDNMQDVLAADSMSSCFVQSQTCQGYCLAIASVEEFVNL